MAGTFKGKRVSAPSSEICSRPAVDIWEPSRLYLRTVFSPISSIIYWRRLSSIVRKYGRGAEGPSPLWCIRRGSGIIPGHIDIDMPEGIFTSGNIRSDCATDTEMWCTPALLTSQLCPSSAQWVINSPNPSASSPDHLS